MSDVWVVALVAALVLLLCAIAAVRQVGLKLINLRKRLAMMQELRGDSYGLRSEEAAFAFRRLLVADDSLRKYGLSMDGLTHEQKLSLFAGLGISSEMWAKLVTECGVSGVWLGGAPVSLSVPVQPSLAGEPAPKEDDHE